MMHLLQGKLFVFGILLNFVQFVVMSNTISCPEHFVCQCIQNYDDYIMECPPAQKLITLKLSIPRFIEIECNTNEEYAYTQLPTMNIGEILSIYITRCPLPSNSSIISTLNKLNITKFRSVFFKNQVSKTNVTLQRKHFNNLDGVEKLYLIDNGFSKLPVDLFDDITNITSIDLQQNDVILPKGIFSKLENLRHLELGHNNLESIEVGLFEKQNKLDILNLWGNNLKNISANWFTGLKSLTKLDLSRNKIESLNSDTFEFLQNLTTLSINLNPIKNLSSFLFSNNKNLEKLQIKYNTANITLMPDHLFANLVNLNEIFIHAGVLEVGENIFEGCINLENVTITNNYFKNLPHTTFMGTKHLQRLDLKNNQLETIDGLFKTSEQITFLSLSHNNIKKISMSTFEGLVGIIELDVSFNKLVFIDKNAFKESKKLELINLQNNHLSFLHETTTLLNNNYYEFSSPFEPCKNLRELHLQNNEITNVFQDWKLSLTRLEVLDLSYNNITMLTLDDLIYTSLNIRVNFNNNHIQELSLRDLELRVSNTKNLSNFNIEITLDNNPFVCDCVSMHLVKYLTNQMSKSAQTFIKIKPNNMICDSPENLKGRKVSSLKLNELTCLLDNPLSKIKRCPLDCICNVRTFDLSIIVDCSNLNLISVPQLPRPSENGLKFIELHIENNSISTLPVATTPGYSEVREIYAAHNNLSVIEKNQIPMNLTTLDLKSNKFHQLNLNIFYNNNKTHNIKSLSLSQNPWDCDCGSLDFLYFIQSNLDKIQDYKEITCKDERLLSESLKNDFCPENVQGIITLSVILALLGLITGTLAALFYKYKEYVMVWCHAHNIRIFAEEKIDEHKKYDAFISYSHKDEHFITDHLVPTLENGPIPYKLCLHIRDWVIGEFIPNQIATSIEESRRTIVVLSSNFLESAWGKWEFLTAHTSAMKEGRARVIVIILGDIGDESKLDPAIRSYLKTNTYIKWGESWFWERLRYAMPHHKLIEKHRNLFKRDADDKLELIIPSPVNSTATTPGVETYLNNSISSALVNSDSLIDPKSNCEMKGHINGAFIINPSSKQSDV